MPTKLSEFSLDAASPQEAPASDCLKSDENTDQTQRDPQPRSRTEESYAGGDEEEQSRHGTHHAAFRFDVWIEESFHSRQFTPDATACELNCNVLNCISYG